MPERANAFYNRLTQKDQTKGHVYHGATVARVTQAQFFLDQLNETAKLESAGGTSDFTKRDMWLFGLVNSLRSSLDSFTYELIVFYGGFPSKNNRRDIQFLNLLNPNKITISLPPPLSAHIQNFQSDGSFSYLNKLRNAQQHRNFPLLRTQSVARMSLSIVGPGSEGEAANWHGDDQPRQQPIKGEAVAETFVDPDLRLPDDPDVEPGQEIYSPGRPLYAVARHLYATTREFLLSSYDLAI